MPKSIMGIHRSASETFRDEGRDVVFASNSAKLGYWAKFPDWAPPEAHAAVDKLFSEPMSNDKIWSGTWLAALPAYWREPDPAMLASMHAATVYKSAAVRNSYALIQDFDVLDDLAKLPNSTLVMFEKSGHFPFITEADDYAAAVRDWVSGL